MDINMDIDPHSYKLGEIKGTLKAVISTLDEYKDKVDEMAKIVQKIDKNITYQKARQTGFIVAITVMFNIAYAFFKDLFHK